MVRMGDVRLAYLAGVIDSDGCISIKRNRGAWQDTYSERVHIRQVDREAIDLLVEVFGGNIGIEDSQAKRGKPLYRWGVSDKRAVEVLTALLPYLRIKREQAINCLALRALKEQSKLDRLAFGRGHVGSAHRTAEMTAQMEACKQQAHVLNRVGEVMMSG